MTKSETEGSPLAIGRGLRHFTRRSIVLQAILLSASSIQASSHLSWSKWLYMQYSYNWYTSQNPPMDEPELY